MLYPIVEYAHKIGKNTADLTASDMVKFMLWWMKQSPRKDLLKVTPKQREVYNKDVAAMNKWRGEGDMAKNNKYNDAMTSRAQGQLNDELVGDSEIMDNEEVVSEEVVSETSEAVICSMELTKIDVDALLFAISIVLEDYEMTEHEYGVSLSSLKEGLMGVE